MGLFRNREVKILSLSVLLITVVFTLLSLMLSARAAALMFFACLTLFAAVLLFLSWRYKQLAQLNFYLKRVNSGDYSLELHDNSEGELSILKSEIYKVTMTLNIQNEQLRKEKTALTDSISDISHQLRTPLTSMFMMTDLLCSNTVSEEKRAEFTSCLRKQLERLQWLVMSLLKISKLDADAVQFKKKPVRPSVLIERAAAPLGIPMELKNQKLTVDAQNFTFECDLNWTVEALINILRNCIEYTPEGGGVRICTADNPLYAQISVHDSGPGIDKADLPYIFNRFYKGRNSGPENVGIGLAMSKRIVEAQGGSLKARNDPDGGAEFIMRFPKQYRPDSL